MEIRIRLPARIPTYRSVLDGNPDQRCPCCPDTDADLSQAPDGENISKPSQRVLFRTLTAPSLKRTPLFCLRCSVLRMQSPCTVQNSFQLLIAVMRHRDTSRFGSVSFLNSCECLILATSPGLRVATLGTRHWNTSIPFNKYPFWLQITTVLQRYSPRQASRKERSLQSSVCFSYPKMVYAYTSIA